jgi:hypothetical protein
MLQISNNKLPISAIVVGCNEEKLLQSCLSSISFCSEILYIDLESTDNSLVIAKKFCSKIFHKPLAESPYCELVQSEIIKYTTYEWILFIDPDEYLLDELVNEIKNIFFKLVSSDEIGAVIVPWFFFYKKYRLRGTAWGGFNKKYLLVQKNRFEFRGLIHCGRELKPNFKLVEIKPNHECNNYIHHQWVTRTSYFFQKHLRYLKYEGELQYELGIRFSLIQLVRIPFYEFYFSFFKKRGYKDFFMGLFLSTFWAFYKTSVAISVYNKMRIINYK